MGVHRLALGKTFQFVLFAWLIPICSAASWASSLHLSWTDNSTDEIGFTIERKTGINGSFVSIASVAADTTSYTDSDLMDGTTYCYRLSAFNESEESAYSNESCAATPSSLQPNTNTVVTNLAAGAVLSGASVLWTAAPSGVPDSVQFLVDGALRWTEFFPPYQFNGSPSGTLDTTTLSDGFHELRVRAFYADSSIVEAVVTVTVSNHTVNSIPEPIVTPAPSPAQPNTNTIATNIAAGAVLSGASVLWTAAPSGVPDSVQFLVDGALQWTEFASPYQFNSEPSGTLDTTTLSDGPHELTVRAFYADNSIAEAVVTVTVSNHTVNSIAEAVVTLTLSNRSMGTRIGIFRPSTGEWFLDLNGNGSFDGCTIDSCITGYGNSASLPIVGDWFGTAKSLIGVFAADTRAWHLDDGDGLWGECGSSGDICVEHFETWGTHPVVKDLASADQVIIGVFQQGAWKFDTNGNGVSDACGVDDECIGDFGTFGDLPVIGAWNGSGDDAIGVFRPQTGEWYLDFNGNGIWDGSGADRLLGPFGGAGDLPVVGDWDAIGIIRVGIYRPSTGEWFLDLNGNGQWDSCAIDACVGPFGHPGDLPVVGRW